jgi:hypothetical protein
MNLTKQEIDIICETFNCDIFSGDIYSFFYFKDVLPPDTTPEYFLLWNKDDGYFRYYGKNYGREEFFKVIKMLAFV